MAESDKKELTFEINNHNQPAMISNIKAWVYQIIVMLKTKPGTIPDLPGYGIGIDSYMWMDANIFSNFVKRALESQLAKYYPDIPVESVEVTYQGPTNAVSGIIAIVFNTATMSQTVTLVSETDMNVINFKIAF